LIFDLILAHFVEHGSIHMVRMKLQGGNCGGEHGDGRDSGGVMEAFNITGWLDSEYVQIQHGRMESPHREGWKSDKRLVSTSLPTYTNFPINTSQQSRGLAFMHIGVHFTGSSASVVTTGYCFGGGS